MTASIQLSDREQATVERIIRQFAGRIGQVKAFGSRATGQARPASDLDLVVYPPASQRELYDLLAAFEESDLPIFVDVLAWQSISSDALREEIERHGVPVLNDKPR